MDATAYHATPQHSGRMGAISRQVGHGVEHSRPGEGPHPAGRSGGRYGHREEEGCRHSAVLLQPGEAWRCVRLLYKGGIPCYTPGVWGGDTNNNKRYSTKTNNNNSGFATPRSYSLQPTRMWCQLPLVTVPLFTVRNNLRTKQNKHFN